MRKYKLISALAEETAKDVVRNEEMHCWGNKGANGIALIDEDSFSGLKYVFDITDNPKAIEVIAELIDKLPDIFGEGVEIDNSEAVQTARRAKELLDKLAEYKPLAKVEELTAQNYNMIDNVLNNGAEKKEQEQTKGRISIKEKMAEKRAVIEQRDKTERTSPEKETEKKSQREM